MTQTANTADTPSLSEWDRYWFAPGPERAYAGLQVVTAISALIWFASWLMDPQWLQYPGQMTGHTNGELALNPTSPKLIANVSYSFAPLLGLLATGAWLATRRQAFSIWLLLLTLALQLAIHHRAAWTCGPESAVLSMLLLYQVVGAGSPSWRAGVAVRLTQLHLAGLLLFTGLQQFRSPAWWNGDAMRWLIQQPGVSLFDLRSLLSLPWLLDGLTHLCAWIPLVGVAGLAYYGLCRSAAASQRVSPIGVAMLAYGAWMAIVTGSLLHPMILCAAFAAVARRQATTTA